MATKDDDRQTTDRQKVTVKADHQSELTRSNVYGSDADISADNKAKIDELDIRDHGPKTRKTRKSRWERWGKTTTAIISALVLLSGAVLAWVKYLRPKTAQHSIQSDRGKAK